MEQETLGSYVQNVRISKNMSQRALAMKAGTTNSTVSRIEADSVRPDPDTLCKIAKALNSDYELMLTLCGYINTSVEQKESPQPKAEGLKAKLYDIIDSLPDETIPRAEQLLRVAFPSENKDDSE